MSDTSQSAHSADTPREQPASSPEPIELRALYEAFLVATDAALLSGGPLPLLPAQIVNSPFREQAESGLHLLQLLSRARTSVLGPEAPRSSGAAVPLERVAHFHLLRELGRGGHGVVYLAVDERLGREVALKVPRPETLVNPELRKRFLREAQAAGQLDHPHLVPVHEVGEEGHLVYIATQYIEGPNLAQWLLDRKTPVPPRKAAELVADLADGVEHAHAHGILHRDIKPSNVLLAEDAGRLSPRLTDFGLAKLREVGSDETQTRTGVLLGTPTYMAPELAAGKLREVGPATDVYGLGAVLYESLTGRPPFRGEHDADTIHQVVHNEPLDPQRLRLGLPRELVAICLKCLEKRPESRYETAAELADDLRRFLTGQPTVARPTTPLGRALKLAKRRPAVTGLSGALVAATLVMVVGGLWLGARLSNSVANLKVANHGLTSANEQLEDANEQLVDANALLRVADLSNQGRELAATTTSAQEHLLNNHAPQARAVVDRYLASHSVPPADYAFRWLRRLASAEDFQTQSADAGAIYALAAAHDGQTFATGAQDGKVRLWNASDGTSKQVFDHPQRFAIYALAFSPRDDLILSGGGDLKTSEVILWDVPGRIRRTELEGPPLTVNAVAFSPDGRWMVAGGSGPLPGSGQTVAEVRIWEIELAQRAAPGASVRQVFSTPRVWQSRDWGSVSSLAFTPDGKELAVGYGGGNDKGAVGLWDVAANKETTTLATAGPVWSVVFADEGRRLVVGDLRGCITVWGYPDRQVLGRSVARDDSRVLALAPSADGSSVFAATAYGREGQTRFDVTQWEIRQGLELAACLANGPGECRALAAASDGVSLLSAGTDGIGRRWNIERHTLWNCSPSRPYSTDSALSPEGTHSASIWNEGEIVVRRLADGAERRLFSKHGLAILTFGQSHQELFTSGQDGLVKRHWIEEDDSREPLTEIIARHGLHPPRDDSGNQNSTVRSLSYADGPRRLASCGNDGRVQVWDLDQRRLLFETPDQGDRIRDVRFSSDGTQVAAALGNGWAHVWRAANGEVLHEWKHREELWSVAFSPDGAQLAVGGDQGTLWLRSLTAAEGEPLEVLLGSEIYYLDYSPDGRTLASYDGSRVIRLWDPISGARLLDLPLLGGETVNNRIRFALNGNALVADVGPRLLFWTADEAQAVDQLPNKSASVRPPPPGRAVVNSFTAYAARFRRAWSFFLADNTDNAANGLEEAARALPSSFARPPFEIAFALRQAARETSPSRGSGGEATCLALTEDGRLAVIGTNTGEFSLVEVPSDTRRTLSAGAPILALTLSRDHSRVFVATKPVAPTTRAEIKVISLTGGEAQNLGAPWRDLFALAASPDGRWLVGGGWDDAKGEVRVRRFDANAEMREAPPLVIRSRNDHHESAIPIRSFAFSPDSRVLAVGHGNEAYRGSSGMVTFWDLETGNEADARFTGFGNYVQSLAFSPDGTILAAGSLDGTLRLWDVLGQRPITTLHTAWPIQRVAFSRDGRFVATSTSTPGSEMGSELLLWDVRQRSLSASLARYAHGVRDLAFLPDGETLLVLTDERALRAIRYEEHEVYRRIPAHEGPILAMEFDSSGRLVTSGRDRTIRTWNLEELEMLAEHAGLEESVAGLALGTDGKSGVTFGDSPELTWRELVSGAELRRAALANELTCVTQAANGAAAAADAQGGLYRWDAAGQQTLAWKAWQPVRQLLFTDQFGRMAVSGCADKVAFWDTQWGDYQHVLEAGGEVCSLALSPDHKLVAAGTARGAIRVWSVERGELVAALREHTQPIVALAFSADGHTLASAARSEAVRLWSVPNLERLLSLQGPSEGVSLLRFSPDNRTLAAGLADGSLVLWRAGSPNP